MVRIRSPTKFNSFKLGDRNFYHLFILERKVEMKKERLKIKGNLVDEVKSHVFIGKNGEVKVYNFTLVKKYGNGKEYINCMEVGLLKYIMVHLFLQVMQGPFNFIFNLQPNLNFVFLKLQKKYFHVKIFKFFNISQTTKMLICKKV